MTRLVNFGLGEVCDRVSILTLKILYGTLKQVDTTHFRNERNALVPQLTTRAAGRLLEAYSDLAAVNAALWHAEEALRRYRAHGSDTTNQDDIILCAFRIQEWNDQRTALIQQINATAGDIAQEKV